MMFKEEVVLVDQPLALWMLLRQTHILLAKARQRELDKYHISEEASAVLFTVSMLGRQATPATMSRCLFLERHSVSQILTRMEKDGLIHKVNDLERKNYVRSELTAKGREIFFKSRKQSFTKSLVSILSEDEQQRLWSFLVRLRSLEIKRLHIKNPLLYPPSDRQEVLGEYAKKSSKSELNVNPAVALWMLLGRTSRLIGKARQRELGKYDVSIDASAVLFTVTTLNRRATPTMVSKHLFLRRHTVSQLLSRMEKDGLIRRLKDLERRNAVRIELTAKGKDIFRKSIRHRSTRTVMSILYPDEQSEMQLLLTKLCSHTAKKLEMENPMLEKIPAEKSDQIPKPETPSLIGAV
jgi:DNA-binding MarR family transcriptional regulator